jgi:hypothetical protein
MTAQLCICLKMESRLFVRFISMVLLADSARRSPQPIAIARYLAVRAITTTPIFRAGERPRMDAKTLRPHQLVLLI